MTDNRRAYKRFKVAIEATLESDAGTFAALTSDLSRGGCFLSTFKEVPVGTTLKLVMSLPTGEATCDATVRWSGKQPNGQTGLGISFEKISPQHQASFEAFCTSNED